MPFLAFPVRRLEAREKPLDGEMDENDILLQETQGPVLVLTLNRPTARHSQIAGPEGCIESEVANYHDNDAVRHSNPKLVFP